MNDNLVYIIVCKNHELDSYTNQKVFINVNDAIKFLNQQIYDFSNVYCESGVLKYEFCIMWMNSEDRINATMKQLTNL